MKHKLDSQKSAQIKEGIPSAEIRVERIDKALDLLFTHMDELCDAVCEDFGQRTSDQTKLVDIGAAVNGLKHAKKNVRKWMRPQTRKPTFPLGFLGAKAQLRFQPKGVVGVISPWNFPIGLTFNPLACIFAAGNRAMITPSEFTENTSELMKSLIAKYYDDEELCVITGGPEVGKDFSQLPFDHLLFTGATSIGRHVMRAAADNLVPVTLELGGKSPAILGPSANLENAAAKIMAGKTLNAGQICLAPDYVYLPSDKTEAFTQAAIQSVRTMYPSGLKENPDYTSMINQRHYDRVMAYISEARDAGSDVIEINPNNENFSQQAHHKIPPHIILNPDDNLAVMQDEVFGPVLPVKTYTSLKEPVDFINSRPRPLGLYFFGSDKAEQETIVANTNSGGVTLNDVIFHAGQDDLAFGGIGDSGMGAYHGVFGFEEFSHKRAVYSQAKGNILDVLRPPYDKTYRKVLSQFVKR